MADSKKESELRAYHRRVLESRKLPPSVGGKRFVFGTSSHFVEGMVESVGYGPSEGVRLYTTVKRFKGIDVKRIEARIYQEGEITWWAISTEFKPEDEHHLSDEKQKEGTLVFL